MINTCATSSAANAACERDEDPAQLWQGRPRILVTEDDEDLAEGLRWMLSRRYLVSTHGSGEEALRSCDTAVPDLLIIDYALPDLTGTELLRRLRKAVPLRLPAIMISAYHERLDDALRCGFDAFLPKPLREIDLLREVRRSLGK